MTVCTQGVVDSVWRHKTISNVCMITWIRMHAKVVRSNKQTSIT
jgi:hypothetical protein